MEKFLITFDPGFRSKKAVCVYRGYNGYALNSGRADVQFWAAVVKGFDDTYGLKRGFCSKTYPIGYQKRPPTAFDASDIKAGDILEVRCASSRSNTEDRFYIVTDVTNDAMTLQEISSLALGDHFERK